MSVTLSSGAARTLFDDTVKHAYQSAGPDLRDCVTFRSVTGSDDYRFRTMGRAQALQRGADQTAVSNANVAHATVTCALNDFYISELTDVFGQATTNAPQEIVALAKTIGNGLKRKEAQLVIDALDAATIPAGNQIGGTNITLDNNVVGANPEGIALLSEGRSLLKANDIDEQPCFLFSEREEMQLLNNDTFVSADYSSYRERDNGDIRDGHYGLKYRRVGSGRDEDGLALSGTERVCYMFVPSAVGLAVNIDCKTEVNYESDKLSWRSTGLLKAGACVIDTSGVVAITIDAA